MVTWAQERSVQLRLIEPGKPNQNAYIESFNGRLRDECLRALVSQPAARTCRDRTLTAGIQRGTTEEGTGRADTRRLCEAVKVNPDSKPSRYSKRGDVEPIWYFRQ